MPKITITTTQEEQERVLEAIKVFQGQTVSVAAIATHAGMNQNRVRYVVADLLEAGKVVRLATKAFNKNYMRYRYEIVDKKGD